MSAVNFSFLHTEWPELYESAAKAGSLARSDPRIACFYARRALELAVYWLYKSDAALKLPHSESLSALIFEPTFGDAIGSTLLTKARIIKDLGNLAVHNHKPIRESDAVSAVRELFHFCFWIARTYARGPKPLDGIDFSPELLLKAAVASHQTVAQLQTLEVQLREKDEKLVELLEGKQALDDELQRLREEVAAAKKANAAQPDTHDYSEAATRDYFIDLLLKEAGWALSDSRDREFPVAGMPNRRRRASSIMCSGAMTENPSLWWKRRRRSATPASASSRQSSMPTVSKRSLGNDRSSFTRTAISIGCGTMSRILRVPCRDSTRRLSWSCSSSDERRAKSWLKQRSARRLSNATIRLARFVA